MGKVQLKQLLWIALASVALVACERSREKEWVFYGPTMGTSFTVKVVPEVGRSKEKSSLDKNIRGILERVDKKMSTYRKDSELSLFNGFNQLTWKAVSSETMKVLLEGRRISEITNGAFDVTIGPLVNLWGFGPDARPEKVPTPDMIKRAKERVGYSLLELDSKNNRIRKKKADLSIDLSAIAKGYAVDLISEELARQGFPRNMVEVGGEIRANGKNSLGEDWRIGIEIPYRETFQEVIRLSGLGMATSGDYRNYYEKEGVRYSHEIDPTSGKPINHKLASVSVLDPSCMRADGYATAFMIMGHEKGMKVAEKIGLAVMFLVREGDGFKEITNSKFDQLIVSR